MNQKISMFFKSRSFKRSSFSAALTIVVIAAVIILNIIVTALTHKYYLYIDMTKDSVFKLTDEALAVVDGIDNEVNIIFCDDADKIQSDFYQKAVYNTALELSAKMDNVHIKHIDLYKNPSAIMKYKKTQATRITQTSVIVESGSESRVYALESFFTFNDESSTVPWAYNGEYKLLSAILQVTADEHPKAYFTIGHGESLVDEALWTLFAEAGYEVNTINLMESDLPDDTRFVIINDPIYDFQGISEDTIGKKSEIEKIDDFLDDFGCLMVFEDPDTEKLPELSAFLKEWGISFDGRAIKDYTKSLTTDGYTLVAECATGDSDGAYVLQDITKIPDPPKDIMKYSTPVVIEFENNGARSVSTMLTTSGSAQVGEESKGDLGLGKFNLMTLSSEVRYVDNTQQASFVLAAGTTNFATNDYIGQKAYSNSDILYSVMKQMGMERVPVDLDLKPFDNTKLDITAREATNWTLAIVFILPVISVLFCIVILVRRRHA